MEKIYYNGNILTLEDDIDAEAILIKDGLISKVGKYDDVLTNRSENCKLINLEGKTLMPSFIDAHSHISAFASTLGLVPLTNAESFDDLVSKLKAFKDKQNLKPGEWIIGFGYDQNNFKEKSIPTKKLLDCVTTENPILITHVSGHMGVLSSSALEAVNITSDSKDPEGGKIGRVSNTDEPNGYLEETAFMHITRMIPKASLDSILNQIVQAQDIYLSYGITTAQEGIINDNEMNLLKLAVSDNKLKIDVIGYVDIKNSKNLVEENKDFVKDYINHFKIGGFKLFLDGSPQGKTAWLTKPYETSGDGYRGYPIYQDSEAQELIKASLDANMQLLTHCNGDAAADQLVNSFSNILKNSNYKIDLRPVMIHAQTIRYDQIDKMKSIGIIPSYFVAHTYYWGDVHLLNLGKERAERISPVKTTIDKDVIYTFHQDTPVIMPNMLETIWCAVNRITKSGVTIGEEEKITPYEALKAVTINAAYQYFEEDKKGSIKEGKNADLIILDKNPLTIEPMEIRNIKILETIKNGKTLWKAD